jgi:hypothetical protein
MQMAANTISSTNDDIQLNGKGYMWAKWGEFARAADAAV